MKWGLITDTHNKTDLVVRAIDLFEQQDCELVFHCGDFENDDIFNLFRNKKFMFRYVTDHKGTHDCGMINRKDFLDERFGRNRVGIYHSTYGSIPTGTPGKRFGVRETIGSLLYDFVFYGHLHYFNLKLPSQINKTTAINSGGFYYWDLCTFCILDPVSKVLDVYYWAEQRFYRILRFNLTKSYAKVEIVDEVVAAYFFEALSKQRKQFSDNGEYVFSRDEDSSWFCKNYKLFFDRLGIQESPGVITF